MSENVIIALQITLIGMGLVFAAILVLWGLMASGTDHSRDSTANRQLQKQRRNADAS